MATEDLGTLLMRVGIVGTGPTVAGLHQVGAAATQMGGQVKSAGADIRSLQSPVMELGYTLMGFAGTLGVVATAAAAFTGIGVAAEFQQIEVGLAGLLGSMEQAGTLMRELQELGRKTPFDTAQLSAMASQMLAVGFPLKTLKQDMMAMADAAAAMSLKTEGLSRIQLAISQIRNSPRLQGDELRQLSESRINIAQLASAATGKDFKNYGEAKTFLQSKTGEEAADILLRGMEKKFGGAAERMGLGTLIGLITNIGEGFRMIMEPTGQLLIPVLMFAGKWMNNLANWLGRVNQLTGGAGGLILLIYGLYRAKTLLIGSVIGAWKAIDGLIFRMKLLGATANTTLLRPGGLGGSGGGGIQGFIKGNGNIIGMMVAAGVSMLADLIPDKRIRGTVQDTAMGAGMGFTVGPYGALIGGIIGLSKGIYDNFVAGGGNTAQERTAKATEQMAKSLGEIQMQAWGGGPRTDSMMAKTQMELAMARIMATGMA